MKRNIVRVLAIYLFCSICFACMTNVDNLMDSGTPIIESSPALVADVKATTHFLGWGNVGDTIISVKADKDVLPASNGKKVDLSSITTNTEDNFRLLSVGGSLSAGFRDGGLYREGQLTAFPNLVARQMGVKFNQPLFDVSDGNGSGYKTLLGIQPIASFKMVTNNLGYVDSKAEKLKKFTGSNLDNYAFPGMNYSLGYLGVNEKIRQKFSDRIFNNTQKEIIFNSQVIVNQSCDFFIVEAGLDDAVEYVSVGNGVGVFNSTNPFGGTGISNIIKTFADKKSKGIAINVPDVLDLPYFSQITAEKIKKLTGVVIRVKDNGSAQVDIAGYRDFNPITDKLIPTPTVQKLMSGEIKGLVRLEDSEVLSKESGNDEWIDASPTVYNDYKISHFAKANNIPVVDLYSIYKKIIAGAYTTHDGVKVDANWAKGNFFSTDGIYPTAFGQAVIANEVIKTMNQHYKLAIPFADTRFFLKK